MWENYEESSKFCCVTTLKKVIRYFSCHMIFVIPSLGYSVNSLRPLLERHNQEPSIRFIFPLMTIPNLPYLTPLSRTIFKIKHIKEHPIWHISCDALDQITLYSLTNGISKLERGNTRFKKLEGRGWSLKIWQVSAATCVGRQSFPDWSRFCGGYYPFSTPLFPETEVRAGTPSAVTGRRFRK